MKRIVILAAVVVLLAGGCADGDATSTRARDTGAPAVGIDPSPTTSSPPTVAPEKVVDDPRSQLLDAVVRSDGDGFDVSAYWGCLEHGCPGRHAISTSSDGFATADYDKWTSTRWQGLSPVMPAGAVPALDGLAQESVAATEDGAEGTQVVIAGAAGGGQVPFQKVGRSSDHGESWQVFDVAPIDGETAYHYGGVALADGRLLVILDHFSDDGHKAPADRVHGLWISDGPDWTGYAPATATFSPALHPEPQGWSEIVDLGAADGVISVRTWDSRLYVSTDDAATFREIPAR